MTRFLAVVAAALVAAQVVAAASPALADSAPEPKKSLDLERFMGRWYEILRTPNVFQNGCYAAWQNWRRTDIDHFQIDQNCQKDPGAAPKHTETKARVLDPPVNAKFEASFFGGLIHKQYWVLDHAADYAWMIASTASGGVVSVLARQPSLSDAEVKALEGRITAMGLSTDKLVRVGVAQEPGVY